jgi:hypothetical protein
MPPYFGIWRVNLNLQPSANPADQVAQRKAFTDLVKVQLKAGLVHESHGFAEGGAGYSVTGDGPDVQLVEALAMWYPHITFELYRTIPLAKYGELAISALRKRSGQR